MISRLTAVAASFAFIVAASLGFAASADQTVRQTVQQSAAPVAASVKPMRVVQLPTVVVVAKRIAHDAV